MQNLARKGKTKRQLAEMPTSLEDILKMLKEKDAEVHNYFEKNR